MTIAWSSHSVRIERTTRSPMAFARGPGPVFECWLELGRNLKPPTTSGSKETPHDLHDR
jgi:hypothetical protein